VVLVAAAEGVGELRGTVISKSRWGLSSFSAPIVPGVITPGSELSSLSGLISVVPIGTVESWPPPLRTLFQDGSYQSLQCNKC
jgi:hypothetical protein